MATSEVARIAFATTRSEISGEMAASKPFVWPCTTKEAVRETRMVVVALSQNSNFPEVLLMGSKSRLKR